MLRLTATDAGFHNLSPLGTPLAPNAFLRALVNVEGIVQKEWALRRAFPVKWTGPEFSATADNVAFESIELAHEGLEKVIP